MGYDRTQTFEFVRGGALAALEFACLFAAGGAAAWLGWSLLTPTGSTGAMAPPPPSSFTADIAALRERPDPFLRNGAIASMSAAPGTATAEGFTLHSIRALGDERSSAILSANGLPQRSYLIGEIIGDARLVEVGPRHVELEQSGRRFRIAFPEPSTGSGGVTQQPQPRPQPTAATRSAPGAEIINAMSLKSVQRADGNLGLEIIPRGDPAILRQVGLAPGDIVLGVNGQTINAQSFAEHRSAIMSGAPVEIRFERAGQIMTTRIGD